MQEQEHELARFDLLRLWITLEDWVKAAVIIGILAGVGVVVWLLA